MKQKAFIIFLLAILIVFKNFGQGFRKGDPPKNPFGTQYVFNLETIKNELKLTDDQVRKIETLTSQTRNTIQIKELEIQKIMVSVKEEMLKDVPDISKISSLVEQKQKIRAEIEILTIKRDIGIKNVLTKEQFDRWRLMLEMPRRKKRYYQFFKSPLF